MKISDEMVAAILDGTHIAVPKKATEAMIDAAETVVGIGPMDILHVDDRTLVRDDQTASGSSWRMGMIEGPDTLFVSQGRRSGPARMWSAMIEAGVKTKDCGKKHD